MIHLEIDSFALRKQRYVDYEQTGFHYSFNYVLTDPFLNYLDILFDYRRALRYKIIVDQNCGCLAHNSPCGRFLMPYCHFFSSHHPTLSDMA